MATNQIGLEKKDMSAVIEKLNNLLSSYHIFYINVRGYHWNVKGEHFFSLHQQFEELYTNLQVQIDEIAERDFAQHSNLKEDKNVFSGTDCVRGVVAGLQELIEEQRDVSAVAEEAEDQGTADLVDEYVQEQEKLVWMYNAFLG